MLCNFLKRRTNQFNVTVVSDRWDREGATVTEGTITIDGEVKKWHLGEFQRNRKYATPLFIDGVEVADETMDSAWAREIFDALAERHCPETSSARHEECPVCLYGIPEAEMPREEIATGDISMDEVFGPERPVTAELRALGLID